MPYSDHKEVVMVWKQDLAKLKQAFPEVGGPPPPPPKPKVKPVEVKNLNDEDAFFLAAMGTPAPRTALVQAVAPPAQAQAQVPPRVEASFDQELADLKGLKPLARNPILAPMPETAPAKVEAAPAPVAPEPPAVSVEPSTERFALPATVESDPAKGPIRIHLAAGMAVEVDATLDLRNHSIPDALGRLRDRLEDGAHMGWRTLHVVLGEDEALHGALLAFLGSGRPLKITRYAQAPIPMGGAQAWVLYY
jgi:hypothetical protein